MPLANRLIDAASAGEVEARYPLHVRVCEHCLLAQHDVDIDPAVLFGDYVYFSSISSAWVEHARRLVDRAIDRFALDNRHLVVEIASNDGYLLRHVVDRGIPALGIEPAANVAEVARARGVPTESRFFSLAVAGDLVRRGQRASLIVANNVLAHVPNPNDFLAGVALLLRSGGSFIAEVPHLLALIEGAQLDTIYHEHFSYLSLRALEPMLRRAGLRAIDVERLPTHGGSLRVVAARADDARPEGLSVADARSAEDMAGLGRPATYAAFAAKADPLRRSLRRFLADARAAGKRVAAFGAAAKGVTLLNYCGVTAADISFVVDETPAKIGKLLPGCRIPIVGLDRLAAERPDFVLILPWNHKQEIAAKLAHVRTWGGRLAVPVPRTEILPESRRVTRRALSLAGHSAG
jgi:SAM-dependent methyltransferase